MSKAPPQVLATVALPAVLRGGFHKPTETARQGCAFAYRPGMATKPENNGGK